MQEKFKLLILAFSIIILFILLFFSFPDEKAVLEKSDSEENDSETGLYTASPFSDSKEERIIEFHFYDNKTDCVLNGDVLINDEIVGKSENGIFILEGEDYENSKVSINGLTDICFQKDKDLLFYETWEVDLKDYSGKIINFRTQLTPRKPRNYKEMQGFVRPEETKNYLLDINLDNDNFEEDLDKITSYRIRYRADNILFNRLEYWQTPKETLDLGHGDCEDWAVTTLSLIREYNSNLKCYNILWETHISIFCFIEGNYFIFDQDETKFKRSLKEDYSKLENKALLRKMRNDYFDEYGIKPDKRKSYAVFNEEELITFQESNDFIDWAYGLSD